MTTALLERADVESISAQARQVRFGKTVLNLVAFVFLAIGWTAAKLWFGVVWAVIAVRTGWQLAQAAQDARGEVEPTRGIPTRTG